MTEQTSKTTGATSKSIHPDTHMGVVALAVADLPRSLYYYGEALGFTVMEQNSERAVLGAGGTPLLELIEHKSAEPWPRGGLSYTGLYHFAILVPTRADLGRWLRHWIELRMPMPGQGDHLVSEALYLEDPDGNGIEIYRDRPRNEWTWDNGQIRMATDPVDIMGILRDAEEAGEPWKGFPAGTKIGHVHLQVADIPAARDFYANVLGFDVVADLERMGALFVSAGGYHHHLGLNTWHSKGRNPAPETSAGLRHFTIHLPHNEALGDVLARLEAAGVAYRHIEGGVEIEDPWHNRIKLLASGTSPA